MAPITRSMAAKQRRPLAKPRRRSSSASTGSVQPVGNLSNAIHPIFRPGNLHIELVGIDEAILSSALRLASLLLTARSNLSFWHTVLFSKVKVATDIIYSSKREFYEYLDVHSELSEDQEEQTKRALRQLADHVKIRMQSAKDAAQEPEGPSAYTHLFARDLAMITLSKSLVQDLQDRAKSNDNAWRLWSSARFAKILVHELAHAVSLLTRGPSHFFFPGSIASEDGFEVESRLWGGVLELRSDTNSPSVKHIITLDPWPNQYAVANYVFKEAAMGLRLLEQPPIISRPGDYVEFVPLSFIERLSDQAFWDEDVVERGRDALRPATVGWQTHKANEKALDNLKEVYKR